VNGGAGLTGDSVMIIGNVNAEFAGARTIKTTGSRRHQLHADRADAVRARTRSRDPTCSVPTTTYQRQKAATQHALELERTALFGKPIEFTATATRSTGGFFYWVTSNVVNAGGTLTWPTVESLFEKTFRYGSRNKIFMISRRIATQLDLIAEGRLVRTGETYYVNIGGSDDARLADDDGSPLWRRLRGTGSCSTSRTSSCVHVRPPRSPAGDAQYEHQAPG
jgi:hypothetical protein